MAGEEGSSSSASHRPTVASLSTELQALRDELARLRDRPDPPVDPDAELQNLRAELAHFQAREQGLFPPKQPKFPIPPKFSGKPSQYLPFIISCEMYFDVMKDTYTTDDLKVAFTISRLRDRASTWAISLARIKDPVFNT
jgi:hypothetical protein